MIVHFKLYHRRTSLLLLNLWIMFGNNDDGDVVGVGKVRIGMGDFIMRILIGARYVP